MTVTISRWIATIAWLALMTVGKPGIANTTDGLDQSRYLGSMSEPGELATSIQVARSADTNPLRKSNVQVVVSGIDQVRPDKVIASSNIASLKLLPPLDDIGNRDQSVATSEPMQKIKAHTQFASQTRGRILIPGRTGVAATTVAHRSLNSISEMISGLVRAAYEPAEMATMPTTRVPAKAASGKRKVPTMPAGFRRSVSSTVVPVKPGTPLLRQHGMSNLSIFLIDDPARAGANAELDFPTSEQLLDLAIFDDSSRQEDEYGCTNCLLGNPFGSADPTTNARSFARIRGQQLTDDLTSPSVTEQPSLGQSRIGKSGLPVIGISHSRTVPVKSVTLNSVYQGIKSIASAIRSIVEPFLNFSEDWRFRQRIQTIHGTLKSAIWPSHLGRNLNTWEIWL